MKTLLLLFTLSISNAADLQKRVNNPYTSIPLIPALQPAPPVESIEAKTMLLEELLLLANLTREKDKGETFYRQIIERSSQIPMLEDIQAQAMNGLGNILKDHLYFERALRLNSSPETKANSWVNLSNFYGSHHNNIMRLICLYRAYLKTPYKKTHFQRILNRYIGWLEKDLQEGKAPVPELMEEFEEAKRIFISHNSFALRKKSCKK